MTMTETKVSDEEIQGLIQRICDDVERLGMVTEGGITVDRGRPMINAIRALQSNVEKLKRDAERYRFLRDEDNWGCDNPSGDPGETRWGELGQLHGDSFDEFVDEQIAALQQEKCDGR